MKQQAPSLDDKSLRRIAARMLLEAADAIGDRSNNDYWMENTDENWALLEAANAAGFGDPDDYANPENADYYKRPLPDEEISAHPGWTGMLKYVAHLLDPQVKQYE